MIRIYCYLINRFNMTNDKFAIIANGNGMIRGGCNPFLLLWTNKR